MRMQELDPKFKITIIQGESVVEAPLPESFGMTVGSEYSTPFDLGGVGGMLSKFLAISGISQKMGVSMKNMFTNPEHTEISFDLEFHAYYSALNEVVGPVVALAKMALGDKLTLDKVEETLGGISNRIGGALGLIEDGGGNFSLPPEIKDNEGASKAMEIIGFISGPETVIIKFGSVYTLSRVYVSSVNFNFSNVVDTDGMPMSATCSVTITPEEFPTAKRIQQYFENEIIQG